MQRQRVEETAVPQITQAFTQKEINPRKLSPMPTKWLENYIFITNAQYDCNIHHINGTHQPMGKNPISKTDRSQPHLITQQNEVRTIESRNFLILWVCRRNNNNSCIKQYKWVTGQANQKNNEGLNHAARLLSNLSRCNNLIYCGYYAIKSVRNLS